MLVPDDTQSVQFHWAHLQPPQRVDQGDGNDGQAEYQYNDGKKPKRSMASSEAADIAIDVPALCMVLCICIGGKSKAVTAGS